MVKVKFVKMDSYPDGVVVGGKEVKPIWSYSHKDDACADIYSAKLTIIEPRSVAVIPTGVKLEIPTGYELVIRPRSGMTSKGLIAQIGTIDNNYRGEIGISLYNSTDSRVIVQRGERIAQAAVREMPTIEFVLTDEAELSDTDRGANGFGSSGK